MMNRGKSCLFVLLIAALGGCAEGEAPTSTTTASTIPVVSKTATATTTPAATENEVASVIAGYEQDWREVIDDAGECRVAWTMRDSDPAQKARRLTCYMRETAMGTTATLARRDLGNLAIPDSMSGLVKDTTKALRAVANVDLEAKCGGPFEGPKGSKECARALGSRMWTYDSLETVLNKWSPYL